MRAVLALTAMLALAACAQTEQQAAESLPMPQVRNASGVPAYRASATPFTTNCLAGGLSYTCQAY